MSDKPRLHQLKTITFSHSTQYKLPSLPEYFCQHGEIPSRMGKYLTLRTNTKPHQLIKHAEISYSIISLEFCKFSYRTYQNGLHQVSQSWGTRSTNHVSLIPFVRNLHFSILLHRVQYLKNLFMRIHKYINSHSLLFAKDMFFGKEKIDIKEREDEQFYV